ncbi:MAG: TetR/AcrR family transcriptional regulator [Acutalibacteraceae bacterium]
MKQEDTRERILEQALELFSEKGYDSVSVGEIARAVGIKAPSLYNHFPSKRAIFDAIVESTAAQYGGGHRKNRHSCTERVAGHSGLYGDHSRSAV